MTPAAGSGGSTNADAATGQTQGLIRLAHDLLDNLHLAMSPSRVSRLVRRYEACVAPTGWTFLEFFSTACTLTRQQQHLMRRLVLADPARAAMLSYPDPTGETAARHVDDEKERSTTR